MTQNKDQTKTVPLSSTEMEAVASKLSRDYVRGVVDTFDAVIESIEQSRETLKGLEISEENKPMLAVRNGMDGMAYALLRQTTNARIKFVTLVDAAFASEEES